MNKITYTLLLFFVISGGLFAQGEIEAYNFSRKNISGTARSMGMGGAFGALGGDQTGISINPAGIAVYRSSEIVGTFDLSNNTSKVGNLKESVTDRALSNLGFVGYFPLRSDAVPLVNFGFTHHRQKSFSRKISAVGAPNNSLLYYIADRVNKYNDENPNHLATPEKLWKTEDYNPFADSYPWLGVLAYNSYLIKESTNNAYIPFTDEAVRNDLYLTESGYIDNYDFTIGTTINNKLNLGLALSVSSLSYNLYSDYREDFVNAGHYYLTNWMNTTGSGFSAKVGAIYRPIHELRIGVAYHTSTWYSLTDMFSAETTDELSNAPVPDYKPATIQSGTATNYYNLTTPDKWVFSVATVLGNRFIASLDYEITDYSKMKLSTSNDNGWYDPDNGYISEDFKTASTLRLGGEYRLTPKFSGRLGYAWIQNPYNSDFKEKGYAAVSGTNTVYRMEGNTSLYTGGIGYRFNANFFLDVALVYTTQKDDLYSFPSVYNDQNQLFIDGSPFSLDYSSWKGLVTLGYKF